MDRRSVLKGIVALGASLLAAATCLEESLAQEGSDPGKKHGRQTGRMDEGHKGDGEKGEATSGHRGHEHGKPAFPRYGLVRAEEGYKEYNVRVQRFSYTPEVIRAERGDLVRLNLDSVDVQHGFYIDGYGVNALVPEEGTKTIEFVAEKAGAFRIRCSSTCGPFHPFMIGKLVVEPNYRFWWSLVAMLLAPFGTLAYLAHKRGKES